MSDYTPSDIEPKWQAFWEKNETFKVGAPGAKKFYCLDMFPYPSGAGLHIGHPLGYTATDIYSRYKRMQGFSVLHPMGFDAFGLPAEQHAVATGEHPGVITEKNCETFVDQMKKIGLSYDWGRLLATCTPDYYKWTQWIFLKIYNSWFDEKANRARPIAELPIPDDVTQGGDVAVEEYRAQFRLAFYADAMVNWCPALGTVLANEEVIDGKSERGGHEVIRKPMKQWMLRITKYAERLISELEGIDWPEAIKEQQRNWIGRRTGAEIHFPIVGTEERVVAFTTRPDTLFGVTFMVLAPEHPLVAKVTIPEQRAKVDAYCDEASRMSEFVRTVENRKKTGVFTGGYVVNPISDEKVPVFVGDYVLATYGTGAVMGVPAHDERDFEFARMFQLEIRPVIAPEGQSEDVTQAVLEGELSWTATGKMLALDRQVAKELGLTGRSNLEAASLITEWLTKKEFGKKVVNYKLRDWLFSRQRYWGEPIPIIHWENGLVTAIAESELPLRLPQVEDYKPSDGGESPLAKAAEWLVVTDPKTGMKGRRETNTMPQWAGSCWYYLRFIDPKNSEAGWNPELEKGWMNVDLYVGGAEHAVLHLLYARFWHKVLYDLGYVSTREPFHRLYNQGMILAHAYKNKRGQLIPVDEVEELENGEAQHRGSNDKLERIVAKMSKSLRNVINPDTVIAQFGADTLRMYLMFMGPLDMARVWDSKAINGIHRFLRRVWSYFESGNGSAANHLLPADESVEATRAIHAAVRKVTEEVEHLRFNTGISALMECLNSIGAHKISRESGDTFLHLLSPYAPHLCEELWAQRGHKASIAYEKWPTYDESILQDDRVTVVIQVNGKKRSSIEVSVGITEPELRKCVGDSLAGTPFAPEGSDKFLIVSRPGTSIPKLVNIIKG